MTAGSNLSLVTGEKFIQKPDSPLELFRTVKAALET